MGIISQILLQRPPDGKYRPGSSVNGTVKFAIDKETIYKDITISLIGKGKTMWSENHRNGHQHIVVTYVGTEDLVMVHLSLIDKESDVMTLSPGVYSHPFQFVFPTNLPSTYQDQVTTIEYQVVLKFTKTFNTELPVLGTIVSTLPEEPVLYGLEKNVIRIFSCNKSTINLKATMDKSLFAAGEEIDIDFVVENLSKIKVTALKIELREYRQYIAGNTGRVQVINNIIKGCSAETEAVGPGQIKSLHCKIPTVEECGTIQNSTVFSRDYKLIVIMRLPIPHINAILEIPILIGEKEREMDWVQEDVGVPNEPPPSYWQSMAEDDNK